VNSGRYACLILSLVGVDCLLSQFGQLRGFSAVFSFMRALPAVRAGSRTRPGGVSCFKGADQVLKSDALLLRKMDEAMLQNT
jgi:hypothetical protein